MTDATQTDDDAQIESTAGERLEDLADCVDTQTELDPSERETSLHFARDEDRVDVYTEEKAITKRLLLHEEFELESYITSHPDRIQQSIDLEEYRKDGHDQRKPVYGVKGTLPIGALKIAQKSRKSTGHADVVSGGVL